MIWRRLGWLCLLAGLIVLGWGAWESRATEWTAEAVHDLRPTGGVIPGLVARYPLERVLSYRITAPDRSVAYAATAAFKTADGQRMQWAILPGDPELPAAGADADSTQTASQEIRWNAGNTRARIWAEAAKVLQQNGEKGAVVFTWWDNAQRLQLLTGLEPWLTGPTADAYTDAGERALWARLSGEMLPESQRHRQLAACFTAPAQRGVECLRKLLPTGRPAYVVVTVEDLLRRGEYAALTGQRLGVRTITMPSPGEIHGVISHVKDWVADQQGTGYLVQQLNPGIIRVWTIAKDAGADTLLCRLLPFSHSLPKPLEALDLVFQSGWGGYLSIYRLRTGT